MSGWANNQDVAHLQAKIVPKNLIWSESAQWLLSSGICKIPRTFTMPIDMLIMPPWVNGHDVAHLQAKTIPMNLTWSKTAPLVLRSGVNKISGAFIMPMGMPIMPTLANDHGIAHQQAKTVPMNLIWSELAQWLPSNSIHKSFGWRNGWTDGRTDGWMDRQTNGRRAFHSLHFFLWKGWGTKKTHLINIIVLLKTNIAGFSPNHPLNGSYE